MADMNALSEVHRRRAYAVSQDSGIGRTMNSSTRSMSTSAANGIQRESVSSTCSSSHLGSVSFAENGEEQVSARSLLSLLLVVDSR